MGEWWMDSLRIGLDGVLVFIIIYQLVTRVRGTRVMQILKGMGVIVALWFVSDLLGLEVLSFLMSQGLVYGILGALIIFQPELRQALEKLGKQSLWKKKSGMDDWNQRWVRDMVEAMQYMSERKIGALICIEREDDLTEYAESGISMNAKMSKELVENIFSPNMPLHDGALIVQKGRLEAASCYLPLSESESISKELGTRHRAAIGLSEVTDALTLVVSEETGAISVTKDQKLERHLSYEELRNVMEKELVKEG